MDYIKSSKEILKAVGNYVYENLNSNNILINKSQGGFYLMPEFVNAKSKFSSSSEMCKNILEKTGVALLPGSDFGFDKKKMLARLSFTDFDGKNFMQEYKKNESLDNAAVKNLAPKVAEGVDKLNTPLTLHKLLHRDTLGKVSWLVNIAVSHYRYMIG